MDLYERAVEHARAGRNRAARRDLDAAARRTTDRDLLARAKITGAFLQANTDVPAAIRTLDELLAEPGLSFETLVLIHAQRGGILIETDGERALVNLNFAAEHLSHDPLRLMAVLFNRGSVWLLRDDPRRASTDFDRAAELATTHGLEWHAANARFNQGMASMAAGDLVHALRLMEDSRPLIERQSPVLAASAELLRAELLLSAGLPDEGTEVLRTCVTSFARHRMRTDQAEAEYLLARTLADTDPREAVRLARRAAARFRRLGGKNYADRADALALATSLNSRRKDTASVRGAEELLDRLESDDLTSARDQLRLALELHHVRAGRPWPRTPDLPDSAPLVSRLAEAEVRVEIAKLTGNTDEALDRARASVELLRAWQGTTDSPELRSSLAMHGYRIIEHAASVAMSGGDVSDVFEWSERSRGFVVGNVEVGGTESDEVEPAELEALRGVLAGSAGHDTPEVVQLRDRVRRRQWARERISRVGIDIVDIEHTQRALEERDATLVAYLSDPTEVSAVVIGGSGAHVVPIGSRSAIRAALAGLQADLDMTSAELRPGLSDAVRRSLRARLSALSKRIWSPLESYVGTRRVAVSAPAALAAVPWNLLAPLQDRSISVVTSATHWMHHAGAMDPIRKVGFIAGPNVPRADTEIEHAAKQWPGATVLEGPEATTANVRTLARETDLLHVAAHGRHTPGNPMFSGLELLDGPWFGHDVAELTMVPSVVVLSACELGRSTARWGEETIGMARAWLHSGVRCVIAAPCTVNDAATSDYLAAVHSGLASGLAPSDALLAAGPDERAPFLAFGAGF
ncbi:CHAT domain-containing protein [Branchiibius sp. NY16-3462-2]|uniref:CHAT domain-containing protein n=1 Tax=Branchiibius sp. NY16-3462-2 TaxID=1807500 RepID=UPI0025B9CD34|nr:CHAT domain-containing protein [Branchiibius sp. NY16-3462-2]